MSGMELLQQMKTQAIAWYMFTDICSYDRTDHVDYPDTNTLTCDLALAEKRAAEAANAFAALLPSPFAA